MTIIHRFHCNDMKNNSRSRIKSLCFVFVAKFKLQWNLSIPATLGTNKCGWVIEVAGFQGKCIILDDKSINSCVPELLL